MSIAVLGDGLTSSEDEDSAGLPPSGVVATITPDPELTDMLARGSRENWAGGQPTTKSRALAAG